MSRASGLLVERVDFGGGRRWGLLLDNHHGSVVRFWGTILPTILASWLLCGAALAVLYLWFFKDKGRMS